jgi:preprotein translocase subunit SecB
MAKNSDSKAKKSAKPAPSKVKATPEKARKSDVSVKLLECFMRDLSVECFLPPAMQPTEQRELDFSLSTAVRPLGENVSCVGVAIRVKVASPKQQPFAVAEMIEEGIFNITCENDEKRRWLGTDGASQVYERARKIMLNILAESGIQPPLPATVDFAKLWDESNAKKV